MASTAGSGLKKDEEIQADCLKINKYCEREESVNNYMVGATWAGLDKKAG
jgi:hypothetical protein